MLALLTALLVASPPGPTLIEGITDVDGDPGIHAAFDVDADADIVLELLWDVSRFKTLFPDINEITVLARPDDRTVEVRFVIDAVVAKPNYTLRRTIDRAARHISWISIAGDVKKIVGHWQITAVPGEHRSRLTYQTVVDVGVPGASTLYRSLVMGKIEMVIDRVRAASMAAEAARSAATTSVVPSLSP